VPIDEPEGEDHARLRLARIGVRVADDADHVESWSNDAWLSDDVVVRVCFRGDRSRMRREAAIGAALPAEARYPKVLEYGEDDDLAWMVVARVAGTPLWERWKTMPERALRPIAAQLADILRTVHAWTPPVELRAQLDAHDFDAGPDARAITGHDLLPLPYPRWEPLADAARAMPFVDGALIDATAARLRELAAHDPFAGGARCLVHGDANFANTMEVDGQITALLDYEWARLGPPDAELVSFVRAAGYWNPQPRAPRPPVVTWLQEDYPQLFAAPDVHERVWVTEIVYLLRQLVVWPMQRPPAQQPAEHPANTLPRLLEAPWEWV
jgi:aminoglycoside phosphotransferase (APT) family kinase protein